MSFNKKLKKIIFIVFFVTNSNENNNTLQLKLNQITY